MTNIKNNEIFMFKKLLERNFYHGSRGGIIGNIKPESRLRCDFGKGFYVGSNVNQAKSLICMDQDPIIYTLKFDVSKIDAIKCYYLASREWMYAVLAYRNKIPEFANTPLIKGLLNKLSNCDLLLGAIADDRMGPAIKEFENNSLTDEGLIYCLSTVKYGGQIVAKTQNACNTIQIVNEHELDYKEIVAARDYSDAKRREGSGIIEEAKRQYARRGQYFFELVEKLSKQSEREDNRSDEVKHVEYVNNITREMKWWDNRDDR